VGAVGGNSWSGIRGVNGVLGGQYGAGAQAVGRNLQYNNGHYNGYGNGRYGGYGYGGYGGYGGVYGGLAGLGGGFGDGGGGFGDGGGGFDPSLDLQPPIPDQSPFGIPGQAPPFGLPGQPPPFGQPSQFGIPGSPAGIFDAIDADEAEVDNAQQSEIPAIEESHHTVITQTPTVVTPFPDIIPTPIENHHEHHISSTARRLHNKIKKHNVNRSVHIRVEVEA